MLTRSIVVYLGVLFQPMNDYAADLTIAPHAVSHNADRLSECSAGA